MAASRILLVDFDDVAAGVITDTLKGVGHAVTRVTDGREAFQRGPEAELLILDVLGGTASAVELCREIRATPALAAIPVLCVAQSDDVESRIAFLEVGADDVVAKPFDARELEARVEALILRFQRSRELATATAATGAGQVKRRMVAVFSPKGGAGTTTIATNLAMALARRDPESGVVVVDLDLQFGQVATHLDLEPVQTLADVVHDEAAMTEPEMLRTYATRHESGLYVLAAPGDPSLAGAIGPDDVRRILETLLGAFDVVVIDAGSSLDDVTLAVFERVEQIVFPVLPEVPALKALHRLFDHLSATGAVAAKAVYVLNSAFAKELVRARDVEAALGAQLTAHLPYDPFLYLKAVNEGVPVVAGAPRTPPAESLAHLAQLIFPDVSAPAEAPPEERKRGILGLRRHA